MTNNFHLRFIQLVSGKREPESGMEKHFLKVIKGEAFPCTKEEKEWFQLWKDLKENTSTIESISKKPDEIKLKKKEPMAILKIGGVWRVIKKTNVENTRFLDAEKLADTLIKERALKNKKQVKVTKLTKNKPSKFKKTLSQKKPTINMKTGWVSLNQGDKRIGDNKTKKQFIDEGIAGTRDENRDMRKKQFIDLLKRTKDD
jgi:hypothetical protein